MTSQPLRWALAPVLLLAACGLGLPGALDKSALAPAGPPLTADETDMAAALNCPAQFTSERNPVLLVHGTGADASIAWDNGLVPVLAQRGYDVCTVNLPAYAWSDVQFSTQYVVHAVRTLAARSGRHVAMAGHSQGALELVWAVRWWPDVEMVVDDIIGFAGVNHGVPLSDSVCTAGACPPAAWQMKPDSQFLAAMNRGDETPGHADYTSLYSDTDTTAAFPTSVIEGGRSIAMQEICPGREVGHSELLTDAIAVALMLDALEHEGPADPARIDPALCAQVTYDGIDEQEAKDTEQRGGLVFAATLPLAGLPMAEPPLESYARAE